MIWNFLKGVLIKILPSLGYKGTIDTQVSIYKTNKKRYPDVSEDKILIRLLNSRLKVLRKDPETIYYYSQLVQQQDKTPEDIISKMAEWEYIDNSRSRAIRAKQNIPEDFIERFRAEIREYVRFRLQK